MDFFFKTAFLYVVQARPGQSQTHRDPLAFCPLNSGIKDVHCHARPCFVAALSTYICVYGHMHVEVRGQLAKVGSPPWTQTQVVMLGGKPLPDEPTG